jgi:hypothetical protein
MSITGHYSFHQTRTRLSSVISACIVVARVHHRIYIN